MIELIRTDNSVLISWLEMRLSEAGIKPFVLDAYTSSVYGGALAAVPRRVMVEEGDLERARRILAEAPPDAPADDGHVGRGEADG